MLMAKSRHKKPENVRRYFKPSPEAIAELTSLLAPGDTRRGGPYVTGPPIPTIPTDPPRPPSPGADMTVPDPVTRDLLAIFEGVRYRLFGRLEGLTDAEYLLGAGQQQPQHPPRRRRRLPRRRRCFRSRSRGVPDPVTTIAWRIMAHRRLCLRGYVIYFFEDVPESRRPPAWPGTTKEGVEALAQDWEHFVSHIAALGDKRLLAPIGLGPGGWDRETYLKLALHALDEAAHHGGEIGLLRDLYLREDV